MKFNCKEKSNKNNFGSNYITESDTSDVLLNRKKDRRILLNVPDPENIRSGKDRRLNKSCLNNESEKAYLKSTKNGMRYLCDFDVKLFCYINKKLHTINCRSKDISTSGILVSVDNFDNLEIIKKSEKILAEFKIPPGSMPEGYEINVKQKIIFTRDSIKSKCSVSNFECAFQFSIPLSEYARKKRGVYAIAVSSVMLFIITFFIILLRVESVLYFRFNKITYLYSIITAVFLLSRYLFGSFYREHSVDINFTPGVTIIIPCFNEETWIQRTIHSCINQDYPIDKLEVIVVDDCSNDNSVEKISDFIGKLNKKYDRYKIKDRLSYVVQKTNMGKRNAMARGVKIAKHDLVVFVDSDSFLDPYAIRNIVQPFKDSKMGGVSGRTDVANTYTNALTKMQSVRYYIAFRIMKAAESYFDAVTCLSGPLSCYRKSIVIENMDAWLNQKFLGQRATFGDDRSMTNFILRKNRTCYQDSAICHTIVPNEYKVFLKQQMRWKRSWLRESFIASKFMWKKEPLMALLFYMGILVPVLAPIIFIYNLFIVPFVKSIFPTTFIFGILLMSMMMSSAQLFLRKSTTWIFGLIFCLYYELVLLWQMPVAWVTFWKTTWGTRMTPEDIREQNKKKDKHCKHNRKRKLEDENKQKG